VNLSINYVILFSFIDYNVSLFYILIMKPIKRLIPAVLEAGRKAREGQNNVSHTYKEDGSILTRFDTELNDFLCGVIADAYPDANIISEEVQSDFIPGRKWTFTIDPIDGTDSYSQGLPGWCVAVGLLDADLNPVGGVIYAPCWSSASGEETLIIAEVGEQPTLNGDPIQPDFDYDNDPEKSQLMISSSLHKSYSIRNYPGKIRYTGCAVLNIISIPLYSKITAALLTPLHIWDIAAAHAVLRFFGMTLIYSNGKTLSYQNLINREVTEDLIIAGTPESIQIIKNCTIPLKKEHNEG
jgi:fructose-1,6-bisphosphatase/inositol monophosphatase family enzyme